MIHSFQALCYAENWRRFHELENFVGALPKDRPLFPNLRELALPWNLDGFYQKPPTLARVSEDIIPPTPQWPLVLSVFPQENIRKLSLHLVNAMLPGPRDEAIMMEIGTLFPNLTSLDISDWPIREQWAGGIGAGVRAIPTLTELSVNIISTFINQVVSDIRYIRLLRVLRVELSKDGDTRAEPVVKTGPSLASLEVYLTGNNNTGQVSSILAAMGVNSIRISHLSIMMDDQVYGGNPLDLINDTVAQYHPDISQLDIQYYNLPVEDRYEKTLSVPFHELLTPLLELSNIVVIDFRVSGSIIVSHETLQLIAGQWPRIQHCHFGVQVCPAFTHSDVKLPHLISVVEFAVKCRYLKTLGVALDCETVGPPQSFSLLTTSGSSLSTLDVGCSPINNSDYVYQVLHAHFPRLVDLYWNKEKWPRNARLTEPERILWKMVHETLFKRHERSL